MLPDGSPYAASDPSLLAWVHLAETTCFLDAWIRYAEPGMSIADQNRYFAEMAQIAEALGANPIARSRSSARQLFGAMRPQLQSDERTRKIAHIVLTQPAPSMLAEPLQAITVQAAIDLLPVWARHMHGLDIPIISRALVRAGTFGIARTLRWALE